MIEKPTLEKQGKRIFGEDLSFGIIQNMAEGVVLLDVKGCIEFFNPAFERLSGYPSEDLLGQHWTNFIPPEFHPVVEEADERRQHGEVDQYEVEFIRKDGHRFPVLITGQPYGEDGLITGSVGVFTDITPLKKAEEALRQSEERYKSLFQQSRDGIFIQSADGILIDVN